MSAGRHPSVEIPSHRALIHLPTAWKALQKAKTIDEVKHIRDLAEAARAYAAQRGLALETQLDAAEIKVRAERRAGEILLDMEKNKGGGTPSRRNGVKTLAEIGIGYSQAHRWQKNATGMTEAQFNAHLERCRKDGRLTSRSVLRAIDRTTVHDPGPLPEGSFRAIYADPPWLYDNTGFDQSAQSTYSGMTIEQLCALPVGERAAPNSVLLCWVTTPMSFAAVEVIRAWGFSCRSKLYWVKPKSPAMGFWVQGFVEELWIAVKGKPRPPEHPQRNVIEAPVTRHSKKPDCYSLVESFMPGPYLELFARDSEERDGWEFWGDQK